MGLQIRQKLSSLGSLFASMPSAAQAPRACYFWKWLGGCPMAALNIAVKALSLA
jgi:hypothetical protein